MPKHSSDKVNAIQSKRKVGGSAAYVSVKFNQNADKGFKLVHVRNRCRIV